MGIGWGAARNDEQEQVMSTTSTIKTTKYKTHDRILAGLFGLCLVAVAVGLLDLLGSF
jgi:hypothetical protein